MFWRCPFQTPLKTRPLIPNPRKNDAKVNARCHTLQNDLRPETRENRCDGEEAKNRILSAKIAVIGSRNEYSQPRVNRTSDDLARSHQKNPTKHQNKWYLHFSTAPVRPDRDGLAFFSIVFEIARGIKEYVL